MTDAVREALEAASEAIQQPWPEFSTRGMSAEKQRKRAHDLAAARVVAAFLRALPNLVVHYRDTGKSLGSFGSTPTQIGEDLAAAVEAERERVREACASVGMQSAEAIDRIRALDLGPTDALATAIAAAEARGMERAAAVVAASGLGGSAYAAVILSAMHGQPKAYDHRDNSPHDMGVGSAIRAAKDQPA